MGTNNIRHYCMGSWAQRRPGIALAVLNGHEVRFNLDGQAVGADTCYQRLNAWIETIILVCILSRQGKWNPEFTHTHTHTHTLKWSFICSPGCGFHCLDSFPLLYCLGHGRLPVIKNNAVVPCCMASNNKELHSYTLLPF